MESFSTNPTVRNPLLHKPAELTGFRRFDFQDEFLTLETPGICSSKAQSAEHAGFGTLFETI